MINPQKPVECEVMDFDMFGGGGGGVEFQGHFQLG